jgi:diguanylate cyclase (GGDEF) domain
MIPHSPPPSQLAPLLVLPERPRLLIVDDQPINIQTLYRIFQSDHEIFMATDGQQALSLCWNGVPPDLILLDIVMPGLDGLTVCRQLKANPLTSDIPVIFVTAQTDPNDETRALEAGGVDFITKPVNPAVVRARVKTHLTLKFQNDLLRVLAFIDGLTGLANRRRFDETLQLEWRRCRRNDSPLALLMIDIDHFKLYNDRYGHQAGDSCLQAVAATLKAAFGRAQDLVARYGGEEFVCLLPECDHAAAKPKADALVQAVAALGLPHESSPTAATLTISLGIAVIIPNVSRSPEDLVMAADAALYQAKQQGRNQVCSAPLS